MIRCDSANPLAFTVRDIRKGAGASFQTGIEQLAKDEQVRILEEIQDLSKKTKTRILPTPCEQSIVDEDDTTKSEK